MPSSRSSRLSVPPRREPIERCPGLPGDLDRRRQDRRPFVVPGGLEGWPALESWSPAALAARFGETRVLATLQLGESGVPYLESAQAHRRDVSVEEFVEHLGAGARCYLDQVELGRFPGLEEDLRLDQLVPGRRLVNLWVGQGTRSGLHYDSMDNLLLQIAGEKRVVLVSPEEPWRLYPFPDTITKSRLDPEALDLDRFPGAAQLTLLEGTLGPGDLLYIPRGWWHFLHAPGSSISVSCWHDPTLSPADELRFLGALGPRVWLRTLRDFLWHGLLGRPFEQRLFSPPPTGKQIWDLCAMALGGRS